MTRLSNKKTRNKTALPSTYGPLATTKEWILCLFSVKHAETTWLRVAEDTERRALRRIERFLFALLGALIATFIFATHQYMFFQTNMTSYETDTEIIYVKKK